uniref:Uncharacterized protein TCIL3000_9_530 n=1 Tax=Trypanosoma congolense (strain IL3000) TaxID=1068625 RepID=G0UTE5_TRYCI|nr:unnamed protein product [Trypanosoma congolense IL3000]
MQQQPNDMQFYQGTQGDVGIPNNTYQQQQFMQWSDQPPENYQPSNPFYGGEGDSAGYMRQQQYQPPFPAQSHSTRIGMSPPYISRTTSCTSPKAFRAGSDRNGFQGNTATFVSGTQSPKHPYIRQATQMPSSSSVPLMSQPPIFHDYSPKEHQMHQQSSPVYQQAPPGNTPTMSQNLPYPPAKRGFFGNFLQSLIPQGAMDAFTMSGDAGAPQDLAPIHQRRFGYPEDDLPLLVELGISPHEVRSKALAVLNPFKVVSQDVVAGMDLAGPIVFAVLLAIILSLRGSMRFSTIYGQFVIGIVFIKVLLSLMTDNAVPLQFVISVLGYGLIPNVFLAAMQSFLYWVFGYAGKNMLLPALLAILWSAWCATSMLVKGFSMEKQRYLIMYPLLLFYAVFAALIIF